MFKCLFDIHALWLHLEWWPASFANVNDYIFLLDTFVYKIRFYWWYYDVNCLIHLGNLLCFLSYMMRQGSCPRHRSRSENTRNAFFFTVWFSVQLICIKLDQNHWFSNVNVILLSIAIIIKSFTSAIENLVCLYSRFSFVWYFIQFYSNPWFNRQRVKNDDLPVCIHSNCSAAADDFSWYIFHECWWMAFEPSVISNI